MITGQTLRNRQLASWSWASRVIPLTVIITLIGRVLTDRANALWADIAYTTLSAGSFALTVSLCSVTATTAFMLRRRKKKGPVMTLRDSLPKETALTPVIVMHGDEYDEAVDLSETEVLTQDSIDVIVEYLAQWDYGDETDGAAEVNGTNTLGELLRLPHDLDEATYGGIDYLLLSDAGLRFLALYRQPLDEIGPSQEDDS